MKILLSRPESLFHFYWKWNFNLPFVYRHPCNHDSLDIERARELSLKLHEMKDAIH